MVFGTGRGEDRGVQADARRLRGATTQCNRAYMILYDPIMTTLYTISVTYSTGRCDTLACITRYAMWDLEIQLHLLCCAGRGVFFLGEGAAEVPRGPALQDALRVSL